MLELSQSVSKITMIAMLKKQVKSWTMCMNRREIDHLQARRMILWKEIGKLTIYKQEGWFFEQLQITSSDWWIGVCGLQTISINNSSCKLKNIKALLAKKNEEMITMEASSSNIARIRIGHENHYSLQDNFQRLKANSMFLSSTTF